MEIFKYLLLINLPYILNYNIINGVKDIAFLFNNLMLYDIFLINAIKFVNYQNNLEKLNNILTNNKELFEYKFIINKILHNNQIDFKLKNIEYDKEELFYYENVKKNKIIKLNELNKILKEKYYI